MKRIQLLLFVLLGSLMICCLQFRIETVVFAEDSQTAHIEGTSFEFDDKSGYGYQSSDPFKLSKYDGGPYGNFIVSGDIVEEGDINGVKRFGVNNGNVTFFYTIPESETEVSNDEWHLVPDKSQNVGSIKIGSDIRKGVLVLQVSKDGKNWIDERIIPNYLDPSTNRPESFYTTSDIQLANGYYYKIILAYRLGSKTGTNKVIVVETDEYQYKKIAEIYEFYLYDIKKLSKRDYTLSKTIGQVVSAGKDNGYSGNFDIKLGDPHYGWKLGHFFVSGYTRSIEDSGKPTVFLKNVGDEVTLWFNLEQDIEKLNNDPNLSIAADTNGYDQFFQIPKTNMGSGTLIIRYTDEKGIKHDPEIYTNFLEANSLITADTIVKLFEEGDYEVALDYEIKNSPRKVGLVEVIPEYSDYRIFFEFSVRNGNSMVYPFDLVTGSELSDHAITPNGFWLDMARSRYLTIDVTRSVLKAASVGFIEDVRFNRPAKDGDEYLDEGIYTFKVKNLYTGEETRKTIYVGASAELRALSANKISIPYLNEQISQGASISADGELLTSQTEAVSDGEAAGSDDPENEIDPDESSPADESASESKSAEFPAFMFALIGLLLGGGIALYLKRESLRKFFDKGE